MQGLRTLIVGAGMAIAPAGLEYLAHVNWDAVVGTKWAFAASGLVMIVMRFITTTPIATKPE